MAAPAGQHHCPDPGHRRRPGSHIPQDRVAELAQRIPAAQLVTVAAGHLIHRAEPDLFIQTVLTFLC